jgi:hypothetical protein
MEVSGQFMPVRFTSEGSSHGTHGIGSRERPRADLEVVEKNLLLLSGIELRFLGRPSCGSRSISFYCLIIVRILTMVWMFINILKTEQLETNKERTVRTDARQTTQKTTERRKTRIRHITQLRRAKRSWTTCRPAVVLIRRWLRFFTNSSPLQN